MNDHNLTHDEKAVEVASGFVELYGPVAELEVARRVLMFEAEGDDQAVAAWRRVGEVLRRLRGGRKRQ